MDTHFSHYGFDMLVVFYLCYQWLEAVTVDRRSCIVELMLLTLESVCHLAPTESVIQCG